MKAVAARESGQGRSALTRLVGVLLGAMFLVGCGSGSSSSVEARAAAYDPGLIQEPQFGDEQGRLLRPWSFSQHAGDPSYEYRIDMGTMTIRRIDVEPWGKLGQRISLEELEPGETLEFEVEMLPELSEEYGEPMVPTGLEVNVRGYAGNADLPRSPMMGSARLLSERLPVERVESHPEWAVYTLQFDLPEGATRLEVAVVMSMGGALHLRRPSLRVVD